ncbi:Uncharacterized protein dnl_12780 [Desulfonema limicola]|uniref:Uncharacterized protein n=1 Tax=Desulfonema limicola TaxID=45656 RepID=A0A975GF87_9BACT|nr:hypothetical protein [Desulfonema limicola]QTA79031.1 Uncharacterized protein dnl_12780 [Desulfonema limicola]
MISIDEIKKYLPQYLSPQSEKQLFEELSSFPENIDKRFYTNVLKDEKALFQGDGIEGLLVINLPDTIVSNAPCIIISNTCDISLQNKRAFPSAVCYAPIFNLDKYREGLIKNKIKNEESANEHIKAIKMQRITQIFYLPIGAGLKNESLIFLDRVNNCNNKAIDIEDIAKKKMFTLSNYGAWLFLLKISIHFTRIADGVDRFFN